MKIPTTSFPYNKIPMAESVQQHDWSKTPLGAIHSWPEGLKTSVNICLYSKFANLVLWGTEMIQIYNDSYRDIIGIKHDGALGARAEEAWGEIWAEIGPMLQSVLNEGKSILLEDHPFVLNRKGYFEECFFTFSYSPIYTGSKKIEGIFVSVTETTQATLNQQQLRTLRNRQLKNLFLQAPLGMCILKGADFIVEVANEKMLEIWGKSLEEVINRPIFEGVPEARNQGDFLNSVLNKGERVVFNEIPLTIIRRGRSEKIFIKFVYEALREENGVVSGIMVLADDITDHVNSRKTMEETEMRQKLAIEAAAIGTFDWDIPKSTFLYSDRLAEIFGYTETSGLVQKNFGDRIHPEDQPIRMKAHQIAFETGALFYEARVVWPDNSIRWVRLNGKVFYDEQGQPVRMYGTTLDISGERTQFEKLENIVSRRTAILAQRNEELKRSEERYHKMVEEVQDYAIILLDKEGVIQNWNKGAEKIKFYKESEIVGKNFQIFYLPDDQANKLPERLIQEARDYGKAAHEGWRLRKDGSKFWGSITITALRDENNNIIGFSKVTRDLTERKAAEDKMLAYTIELESQNKELEQFAYVASHDLQEPLRKIRTFTDVIQKNIHNETIVKKYFDKVESSARRMSELIQSVLNYSRLAKNNDAIEEVDLNSVLQNVEADFELLIEEKGAKIVSENLPKIKGVVLQLNQLFANLISNGLKFCTESPVIKISSRIVSKDQIINAVNHLADIDYLEISFSDNGIGFEQKYEKQIFTMFQRLHGRQHYAGTGIGLALCKKIIENHNGYITARGELGKGSTFYVYLPSLN